MNTIATPGEWLVVVRNKPRPHPKRRLVRYDLSVYNTIEWYLFLQIYSIIKEENRLAELQFNYI